MLQHSPLKRHFFRGYHALFIFKDPFSHLITYLSGHFTYIFFASFSQIEQFVV